MPARTRKPHPPAAEATGTDAPTPEERIWQAVHAVPRGRVSTYGAIAALAGLPGRARLVGRTLSRLPARTKLPWHRIVNAAGGISVHGGGEFEQARRLAREGVLPCNGRIDLARHGWPERQDT